MHAAGNAELGADKDVCRDGDQYKVNGKATQASILFCLKKQHGRQHIRVINAGGVVCGNDGGNKIELWTLYNRLLHHGGFEKVYTPYYAHAAYLT